MHHRPHGTRFTVEGCPGGPKTIHFDGEFAILTKYMAFGDFDRGRVIEELTIPDLEIGVRLDYPTFRIGQPRVIGIVRLGKHGTLLSQNKMRGAIGTNCGGEQPVGMQSSRCADPQVDLPQFERLEIRSHHHRLAGSPCILDQLAHMSIPGMRWPDFDIHSLLVGTSGRLGRPPTYIVENVHIAMDRPFIDEGDELWGKFHQLPVRIPRGFRKPVGIHVDSIETHLGDGIPVLVEDTRAPWLPLGTVHDEELSDQVDRVPLMVIEGLFGMVVDILGLCGVYRAITERTHPAVVQFADEIAHDLEVDGLAHGILVDIAFGHVVPNLGTVLVGTERPIVELHVGDMVCEQEIDSRIARVAILWRKVAEKSIPNRSFAPIDGGPGLPFDTTAELDPGMDSQSAGTRRNKWLQVEHGFEGDLARSGEFLEYFRREGKIDGNDGLCQAGNTETQGS